MDKAFQSISCNVCLSVCLSPWCNFFSFLFYIGEGYIFLFKDIIHYHYNKVPTRNFNALPKESRIRETLNLPTNADIIIIAMKREKNLMGDLLSRGPNWRKKFEGVKKNFIGAQHFLWSKKIGKVQIFFLKGGGSKLFFLKEGWRTNEKPGNDHVIPGPMRGLEKKLHLMGQNHRTTEPHPDGHGRHGKTFLCFLSCLLGDQDLPPPF